MDDNEQAFETTIASLEKEGERRMQNRMDVYALKEKLPVVLADVMPLSEHMIDSVERLMTVRKYQNIDTLPDDIRFVIPARPADGSSTTPVPELVRYVRLDSMPPELKKVVTNYLTLLGNPEMMIFFKGAVQKLNDEVQQLPDKTLPK